MRIPEIYVLVSGDNDVDYFLNVGAIDIAILVYIAFLVILSFNNEVDDGLNVGTINNTIIVDVSFDCFGLCHNTLYGDIAESVVLQRSSTTIGKTEVIQIYD